MDPFNVHSSEKGMVRVFTTDLDPEGSAAITPANVHKLLGENLDLDPSRIEVFPSHTISAIGLSAYLAQGYGIPEKDLQGKAAALDALSGLVILVASSAFKGQSAQLAPKAALRFVGLFAEPAMAPPQPMAAPNAAEGVLTPATAAPPPGPRGPRPWPIVLAALLIAAGLVLFLVL